MRRILRTVSRLNRDSLPHYTKIVLQVLHERFSTTLSWVSCLWWGIKLGSNCTFVGRAWFARCRGSTLEIGERCRFLSAATSNHHGINRPCMLSTLCPEAKLKVGRDVGMSGTVVCCATRVEIGDRVLLGANTTVTDTDSHPVDYRMRFPGTYGEAPEAVETEVSSAPISIGDDVFIGMHTIILKGVAIGRGTVIAAGSVVSRSLPAYCIAAGNPAKPLKFLEPSAAPAISNIGMPEIE